jgi:hypothetical protein
VALPEDLPIPVAYLPDLDEVQPMLRELGVKPFEWRELIRDLIKLLASRETDGTTRINAMAGLRAYHQVRLSGSEELEPVLGGSSCPRERRTEPTRICDRQQRCTSARPGAVRTSSR